MISFVKAVAIALTALILIAPLLAFDDHDHHHESDATSEMCVFCHTGVAIIRDYAEACRVPTTVEAVAATEKVLHERQSISDIFRPPVAC